jgi:uroporphyrinogen decarboxylase
MRQAGRYLPGYRKLREQHGILELAKDPRLASEVALEPLRLFDLDAAIVFADIVHPLEGTGVPLRLDPGTGPVVLHPVRRSEDLETLRASHDVAKETAFVGETIRRLRDATDKPVLGFSAAPFTLACYLVEGAYARDFPEVRRMILGQPDLFRKLLMHLTGVVIDYLRMQERAGAQALQVFDTWAGLLSPGQYSKFAQPSLSEVLTSVDVPTLYFSTSSRHLLELQASLGATGISVDWRVPIDEARKVVGAPTVLQGNLDPAALLASPEAMEVAAGDVLRRLPRDGHHIFNLGHGVLPQTDPQNVKRLVDFVHAHSGGE